MIKFWSFMTTEEMSQMEKENSLVLLPVSATEQHGGHLPLGTDSLIVDGLLKQFKENVQFQDHNVLIAPTLSVGKSNEHLDFSGSLSFSAKTLYSMIEDLASSFHRHGFKKLLLFNSHGGNTDLLNLISRDIRIEYDMEVYVFDWWFTPFWNEILEEIQESGEYGVFHACELEASIMLSLYPDYVYMDKAVDDFPKSTLETNSFVTIKGPVQIGWKTKDITDDGVIGAPTLASKEKGEKLLEYAIEKVEKIILEIMETNYLKN